MENGASISGRKEWKWYWAASLIRRIGRRRLLMTYEFALVFLIGFGRLRVNRPREGLAKNVGANDARSNYIVR